MSAGLTTSDGMFTVRQSAWHGLGTVFNDYPKRAEAQAIAHPWDVAEAPLYRKIEIPGDNPELPVIEKYEEIDGWRQNVRDDDQTTLGVVADSYTNVTNNEIWDIAEAIEKSGSDVMFETAGSLNGGRQVWVLIRLEEPIVVTGDPRGETIPYFALQNSHDGSGAFRGQATTTRIVCQNTARMADMDAQQRGTEFTFRHSKNVGERIEQAKEALAGWRESIANWQAQSEQLISQKIQPLAAIEYLDRFIPMPPVNIISERVAANVERDRKMWLESYNGVTGEGLRDTSYGLVQASLEFLNWHRRANSEETRFRRTFLSRDALVSRAVDLANQAATVSF
jgi:phage/plasmid-like protein (TIGR03299 family)